MWVREWCLAYRHGSVIDMDNASFRGVISRLLPGTAMDWGVEPTLVTFFIPLLDRVGLPHDSSITCVRDEIVPWLAGVPMMVKEGLTPVVDEEGHNYVSMLIWRPKERISVPIEPLEAVDKVFQVVTGQPFLGEKSDAPQPPDLGKTAGTVITAVTPLIRNDGVDLAQAVGEAFDRCLEELGIVIRAYVTEMGATYARFISRRNVFPIIVYWLRHPFDDEVKREHRVLFIHEGVSLRDAHPVREVDDTDFNRVLAKLSRIKQGDPLQAMSEQFYKARRAFWIEGDYAATVGAAYTAGEVLLNSVLLMVEWEKGTEREVTRKWFEEQGLAKRLRTYYHDSLGGNWDPQNRNGMIRKWMALAELRGRVVHAGYMPSEQESETALMVMQELLDFVKGRLAAKRNSFPRTTLLLLGEPGLRRLNKWDRKIDRFVQDQAGAEEPWIASFRSWLSAKPGTDLQ